jgi:glycosyltransferase involved in cell wall biosynthesis
MTDRLRVAVVAACPFPWPRGTPIRIERIADAIARRGHAVHVVTYHLGEDPSGRPYTVHRIRDVPAYRRTAPGPTFRKLLQLDPMLAQLLRRLHRDVRFDVVHAHHYEGLLVASRAVRDAPIVYDAHTLLGSELPTYPLGLPRGWVRALAPWLDRHLPRRADRVIAVSETIAHALATAGATAPDHLHVIPNGVEWQRFAADGAPVPDGRTVIFTGNLAPYQGVDFMLDAFARLHATRPDARLMIVTDSAFEPFEALTRRLGVRDAVEVRQAPFAEQPALLARAGVAINPRIRCDGIPQKLLNYMAAGMPIASFESSAGPLRHQVTGLRVPDGDAAAMAGALERLLGDRVLARAMGEAAREQARREFSWDQVACRVEEVYRSALGPRKPGQPEPSHSLRREPGMSEPMPPSLRSG